MRLPEICIRRPVFATVMSLLLVLIGMVAYTRLSVREYPNIDEPVVSVSTSYPGASAQIMESQITQVLEGSIAGIEGIDTISSSSRTESSRISIRFRQNVDPDVAASDVRDRVGRVRGRLPDEITEPVIAKVEADAQPIMNMAFTSDRMSPLEITDYLDRFVRGQFQNLPGVADIQIQGERRYAMRVWIDRARLAAYSLTIQDVEQAMRNQNLEVPAGRIESVDREFSVLARTGLQTPEQFGAIVVKDADGFPVRLRDLARIELGAANERLYTRANGSNVVSLGVVKQATANPLDVSAAVRARLPGVVAGLPEGMTAEVATDNAVFIDRSIKAVYTTIGEAVVLVVLVIFFFLRTLRATLIPLVTIPVSLIATFTLMYALGFSVNTLTLLAMVLAIGLVVDDAIVVLENVVRYVEQGMPPRQAALKGTTEIAFAVVAMTVTLAAVYAPVAFAPGRTGKLFVEFALTLAGAVLVSGFVALTLTPMMCSKLLRHRPQHGPVYRVLERGFEGMNSGYRWLLRGTLRVRFLVVLLGLGVAGASGWLLPNLKSELAPVEDRGVIQGIASAPEGATVEYTARYARQLEALYQSLPEMQSYFILTGFPEATRVVSFVRLKDWEERSRKQQDIAAELQPKMGRIAGLSAFPSNPPSLGGGFSSRPIDVVVLTSGTYEQLQGYIETLMAKAREYPGFVNLETDLVLNKPQIEVVMNRDKVADAGLNVSTIGRTLESLLAGRTVTRFDRDGEQYDVIV
ncbi:MAG TPA: efflux RND transporter permease subunit, partial [Alphaproteobacteria bacterium]|nr:efflux RND transporter permease subunit [Alphaproteobacteria bacterium]